MPPLPKKKHTRARKGGRSAHHFLTAPSLSTCPNCKAAALPHRVCGECGFYNGRNVTGESATAAATPAKAEGPTS